MINVHYTIVCDRYNRKLDLDNRRVPRDDKGRGLVHVGAMVELDRTAWSHRGETDWCEVCTHEFHQWELRGTQKSAP